METITIQIGNINFDIPIQLIKQAKPFDIECITEIEKIKGNKG